MIEIDLKLFVTLARYLPETGNCLKVAEGTSVARLIQDLNIPEQEVKLVFVNGRKAGIDHCLEHNDRVGLFPPVGGG